MRNLTVNLSNPEFESAVSVTFMMTLSQSEPLDFSKSIVGVTSFISLVAITLPLRDQIQSNLS